MKNLTLLIVLFLSFSVFGQGKSQVVRITDDLSTYLDQRPDDDLIRINIRLKDQFNSQSIERDLVFLDRDQRREFVKRELKVFSRAAQSDLVHYLENKLSDNEAEILHRFWIANVVTCLASEEVIYELAKRDDIERIDIDEVRNLLADEISDPQPSQHMAGTDEITYNVSLVNAPAVWALGFSGEGVVISIIDSGVNYDHEDLADHMWTDPSYPNHGWDFYNNDDDPMDGFSHGTHCAGTVAGDGTAGSQTGIAPDAQIMALKVLADNGDGQESDVWEAIEFTVDNGGDVISMSLGWSHDWNPDRATWRNTMDNALAAGVIAAIAAGNEGGNINDPDDVRTPGDCPPPWLNPDQTLQGGISAVVCVGATDSNDDIAGFSSRGPSDWELIDPYFDYPFDPEMGLIRPDVSAPGVDIKSCDAFNTSGYSFKSGTSMATPCTAGVMALLLSKNINLTPEEITIALETTALDLGVSGKDNVFGSGRIDALEAINNINYPGPVYNSHLIDDGNGNGEIESGESVLLSIEMYNGSESSYNNVDVTLSSSSPYVSITDNSESYGDFSSDEYKSITNGFAFDVIEGTPGNQNVKFDVEASDGNELWTSHFSITTFGPNLEFGTLTVDDVAQGNGNGRLDPGENADLIIRVHNYGQEDATDTEVNLDIPGGLVIPGITQHSIPLIVSEGYEDVGFPVTVSGDAIMGSTATCNFDLQSGVFTNTESMVLKIGIIVEDWESNSFDQFDWTFEDEADWVVSSETPYEGVYCSQSGNISDLQSSSLLLTHTGVADDSISFYKEVSSEATYDFLKFYIDDILQDQWSGEIAWSRAVFPVSAGIHTFKWEYFKDQYESGGDDRARIDFIVLPPVVFPTVNAGNDTSICSSETFSTEATAEDYDSLEWMTSGDGTFDDKTLLNAVYTPGTADIDAAEVTLTLMAYGSNGNVSNSMLLAINTLPEIPGTPEGAGLLCINPGQIIYHVNDTVGYTYSWEINPIEAGTTESDSATAVVNWSETFTGEVEIQVNSVNECGESELSAALLVTIHNNPDVDLGEDLETCTGNEIPLDAGNEGATYLWSTGEITQIINVDTTGMDENKTRTISVEVTDINDCSSVDEVIVNFIDCSSINEVKYLSDLIIIPNPSNGVFTVKFKSLETDEANIELIDLKGNVVYNENMRLTQGRNSININVPHLANQLYYVRIITEKGVVVKKLIIEK